MAYCSRGRCFSGIGALSLRANAQQRGGAVFAAGLLCCGGPLGGCPQHFRALGALQGAMVAPWWEGVRFMENR